MPLTATQRDFVTTQLGVQPKKKTRKPTEGQREDGRIRGALNDYLGRESKVLATLSELQNVPGAEGLVAEVEKEIAAAQNVVQTAKRENAASDIDSAFKSLEAVQTKARELADQATAHKDFYARLDTVTKDLKALEAHPQHDHVKGEIDQATIALETARTESRQFKYTEAEVALTEAGDACRDGKKFADDFADFVPVKANAGRIVNAMKDAFADKSVWQGHFDAIALSAAKADPPTRDYSGATSELNQKVGELRDQLTNWYLKPMPKTIADLKKKAAELAKCPVVKAGETVIDEDINAIIKLQGQVKADINASKWGQAVMTAQSQVGSMAVVADKTAGRRLEYDKQRAITTQNILGLKDHKSLLGHMFSMQKLVERADGLASRKAMRMEDGIAELAEINANCAAILKVATDAEAYLTERVEADKKLAEFSFKKPLAAAAAAIESQIGVVDTLLAAATKATGIINAESAIKVSADMEDHLSGSQDWGAARGFVRQAMAEMKAAEILAISLGDVLGAQERASEADDPTKVQTAVEELRKQAEVAKGQPHADLAEHEFTHIFLSLDEALDQAKEGHIDIARIPLQGAAELLLTAKTVQAEHTRFLDAYKTVADRAKTLTELTDPPASTIKAKTDLIAPQLTAATEHDATRAWDKAGVALRAAEAAATEAELFAKLRKEFNARATTLDLLVAGLANPPKDQVEGIMTKAKGEADGFNLDYANRFLDNAEARIKGAEIETLAKATPYDEAALMDVVDKMLAAKGGQELLARPTDNPTQPRNNPSAGKKIPSGPELLDEIVKNLPDDVPPKVIAQLFKKRFGVDLYVSMIGFDGTNLVEVVPDVADTDFAEDGQDAGHSKRTKSGRKMYEMFALVPEQGRNNPSMKRIERRNATSQLSIDGSGNTVSTPDSGGFYQTDGGLVVMSGRPDDNFQQFGKTASELPDPIEKGFEPVDETPVDYFDFATVHEVGHAVDDRMGFMASREGQAAFGGWKTYGGAIDPIVKAVAKKYGGQDAALLEEYVTDKMTGNTPDPPAAPPGQEVAWKDTITKIDDWYAIATGEQVWWNQGQSDQITIDGVIYQQAYANTWVSYLASERRKGITGYQFRAPGEWFAELYAAYHVGKLKQGHPARAWLSSLSL